MTEATKTVLGRAPGQGGGWLWAVRAVIGGGLMGLANLVPGISGGTMLLAAGVYPAFIDAIAELTTFRIRLRPVVLLGIVVGTAALAILLLAGVVKELVVDHRWVMYCLFVGLTLGGVPVVWQMTGRATRGTWVGAAAGFAAMALIGWWQTSGAGTDGVGASGAGMLFLAGLAGASAMILPGISGGYLLLVLGQYVPILSAIDRLKDGLRAADWPAVLDVGLRVCLPVGLGVLLGVVGVSHLLRWLLRHARPATLGGLLGLLLGAVVGLWPFQAGVRPEVGDWYKGRTLTEPALAELAPEDYPTEFFRPSGRQAGAAALLVLAGFAATALIARLGGDGAESGPGLGGDAGAGYGEDA